MSGPVASLFGAMVFPKSSERAEIYAAHWISTAIGQNPGAVHGLAAEDHKYLYATATKYGEIHQEASKAIYRGTQCEMLVSYLWRVKPGASWEDAFSAAEQIAGRDFSGVRSAFQAAQRDFNSVLHYWGILSNDHGNRWPKDFRLFISQSTTLLKVMRLREEKRELRGKAFSAPKIAVPFAAFDWRVAGRISSASLPESLAPIPKDLGGRPSKPLP